MSIKRVQRGVHVQLTSMLGYDYEKHPRFNNMARELANRYSKFSNHRLSVLYRAIIRYPKELKLLELLDGVYK